MCGWTEFGRVYFSVVCSGVEWLVAFLVYVRLLFLPSLPVFSSFLLLLSLLFFGVFSFQNENIADIRFFFFQTKKKQSLPKSSQHSHPSPNSACSSACGYGIS